MWYKQHLCQPTVLCSLRLKTRFLNTSNSYLIENREKMKFLPSAACRLWRFWFGEKDYESMDNERLHNLKNIEDHAAELQAHYANEFLKLRRNIAMKRPSLM